MSVEVSDLVYSVFGLQGAIEQIGGYYDRNFKLTLQKGDVFLVKLSVPQIYPGPLLPLQNEVLIELEGTKLGQHVEPYAIFRTKTGDLMRQVQFQGETRWIRIFKWINGEALVSYEKVRDEVFIEVGTVIGSLSIALQKIGSQENISKYIKELKHIRPEEQNTDPMHLPYLYQAAKDRIPAQLVPLLKRVVDDFKENRQTINSCCWQLVHHDANQQNILVRTVGGEQRVVAIIDYEEIKWSPKIVEMATCCARSKIDPHDPLKNILLMLRGYSRVRQITPAQKRVFFVLMKARLAVLVMQNSDMAIAKKGEANYEYLLSCLKGKIQNLTMMIKSATNEQFQHKIDVILAEEK